MEWFMFRFMFMFRFTLLFFFNFFEKELVVIVKRSFYLLFR